MYFSALSQYVFRQLDAKILKPLLAKTVPLPDRRALRAWRAWAVASDTVAVLWREVVSGRHKSDDAAFLVRQLPREDKKQLALTCWTVPVGKLSDAKMHQAMVTLTAFATRVCRYRARFIVRYDMAYDIGDLVATAMEAAVRAIRRYEHDRPYTYLVNTAKMAIKHEVLKSLSHATRGKRARICVVEHDGEREYVATTSGLEAAVSLPVGRTTDQLLHDIRVELGEEHAFVAYNAFCEGRCLDHANINPQVVRDLREYLA